MTILPRGVGFSSDIALFDEIALRFGRLTIAFRRADEAVQFSVEETHLPFVAPDDAAPDFVLTCSVGPVATSPSPIAFTAGDAWEIRRDADGTEDMIMRGGPAFGQLAWRLRLDPTFRSGQLIHTPMADGVIRADGYPLLEYLVVRLLPRHNGLLLHASTAVLDGGSYLFVGHSGAGKSTMAAIAEAEGARIPTDDRTIVTVDDRPATAWGTPWHGSLVRKSPEGAPLRGIFLLQQAPADRVQPLSSARAVHELFVRLIQPRLHGTELVETLRLLEDLVQRVPVSILEFRPTAEAFRLAARSTAAPVR